MSLVALKHAVLASLSSAESSGYELSKHFDASVANFWPASAQQIYRELGTLEADGLVKARTVRQQKRPDKRIFRITAAGRDELDAFIRQTTKPTLIRDDLLVKVASLDRSNTGDVADAVRERLEASRKKLAIYEELRASLLAGQDEARFLERGPDGENFGPYLALKRGISFEQDNIRWNLEVLELLDHA